MNDHEAPPAARTLLYSRIQLLTAANFALDSDPAHRTSKDFNWHDARRAHASRGRISSTQ